MDTLTHALSGALLARATEPATPRADELPRWLRMTVGFFAAAFPDADFVINFIDPFTYITTHRGITHSIILLPLWAAALAGVFTLLTRRRYPWRAFVGVCALGIGAHIAGDIITSFGTMVFAPFSKWRLELSTTFIIDLYFSGIIVAGLAASALWRRTCVPAVAALALLAGYVGLQAASHARAVGIGEQYIAAQNLNDAHVAAIPQPFSPFNWMVLIEQPRSYQLTYISLSRDEPPVPPPADAHWLTRVRLSYRPVKDAQWQTVPRFGEAADAALAESAWNADTMARYRQFALFPAVYRIDRGERSCVWFSDLRFALVSRPLPFRYGACQESASWRMYRLTNGDNGRDLLEKIPD